MCALGCVMWSKQGKSNDQHGWLMRSRSAGEAQEKPQGERRTSKCANARCTMGSGMCKLASVEQRHWRFQKWMEMSGIQCPTRAADAGAAGRGRPRDAAPTCMGRHQGGLHRSSNLQAHIVESHIKHAPFWIFFDKIHRLCVNMLGELTN